MFNSFFAKSWNYSDDPLPLSPQCCVDSEPLLPDDMRCTDDDVHHFICSMDPSKANGPDGISVRMLISTAATISSSLANLFHFSLSSGCFPSSWKLANVVSIPKLASLRMSKSLSIPTMLSIVSKLFEKHIHYLISPFIVHYVIYSGDFKSVSPLSLPCCLLRKTGLLILTSTKKFAVSSLISKRHSILCRIKGL